MFAEIHKGEKVASQHYSFLDLSPVLCLQESNTRKTTVQNHSLSLSKKDSPEQLRY